MRSVRRHEHVPYRAEQMFDLVNDIEAYPEFLHWCRGASIERSSETEVVATLDVGLGGIRRRFTTRNGLERPRRISMTLVDGPFRSLSGQWEFEERGEDGGSTVRLGLDFEVSHTPLNVVFAMAFEEIVRSQVAAFIKRAGAVYG